LHIELTCVCRDRFAASNTQTPKDAVAMASSDRRNGLDHMIQITVPPDKTGILTRLETAGLAVAQESFSPVDDSGVVLLKELGKDS
jgi:hypothetical protein